MSIVRLIGVDPGLGRMGWGVVERDGSRLRAVGYGLIETAPGSVPGRLLQIERALERAVVEHAPEAAATERLFFGKNQTTGIDVAKALGVAQLVLARAGLDCIEYSPPEVKLAVVGTGRADKHQVQFMVTKLLGLEAPPRPDDVADALAVAITRALAGPRLGDPTQ